MNLLLLPIALVLVLVVPEGQALAPLALAGFIVETKEIGAPLAPTALARLVGPTFGIARATRSTDVILSNASGKEFKLAESSCTEGQFSPDLLPDQLLPPLSSWVYGSESASAPTGVNCKIRYVSTDEESYFQVGLINPVGGRKEFFTELTPDLIVNVDIGPGTNNVVRVLVKDNLNYVAEDEEEEEIDE